MKKLICAVSLLSLAASTNAWAKKYVFCDEVHDCTAVALATTNPAQYVGYAVTNASSLFSLGGVAAGDKIYTRDPNFCATHDFLAAPANGSVLTFTSLNDESGTPHYYQVKANMPTSEDSSWHETTALDICVADLGTEAPADARAVSNGGFENVNELVSTFGISVSEKCE